MTPEDQTLLQKWEVLVDGRVVSGPYENEHFAYDHARAIVGAYYGRDRVTVRKVDR